MSEIDEMKKELERNPILKDMLEKQVMYYFTKWIEEKNKEQLLKGIPKSDMDFLFQCILIQNISDSEIEQSRQVEDFRVVEKMFKSIMEGQEELLEEVNRIYVKKVNSIKAEYEKKIDEFKYNSLPKDKREQIKHLRANQKHEIVNEILNSYNKYGTKVKEIEKGYQAFVNMTHLFDVYQFNAKALSLNEDKIPRISFAVYSPQFLMPAWVDELLNNNDELPSNWYLYHKLTITEYKELLNRRNSQQAWNELFNMAGNNVLNKANIPILPIVKRKDLLDSILENFQNKHYDSALIITFSVIEGLLWELALIINKKEKVFIGKGEMYDCEKKESFKSNRIRDVVERTVVKNHLDKEFIKEFCEELYEERNPVLHGNFVCHYECKDQGMCFIKKLFVLDYIIDVLEEEYRKIVFDEWDNSFDEKKIKEFIRKAYGMDNANQENN